MSERAFFMHCEVDTDVINYRAQPFRLEFVLDGRKRTYIADCVRVLASGGVELVEIKSDPSSVHDPDYREKLEAVRAICSQVGWRFRLIFNKALTEPAAFHRNVVEVQSRRMAEYSDTDVFRVVEALGRQPGATLGDVAQDLGSRDEGLAKLKAMMVGRIVRLDLTEEIGDATPVCLVSGEGS
ncbi:TnsA endonuclease N-terminal domain-containing protein [Brevundimonas vesicularis]|uniref:TnsA endonuclease N-terminal domain-containing protein n=1 Tax=Brevundimonas vesicularis TaxID=41276 RepID=UPI0028A90A12|nr:TnsA endonuclease N-terminal domain-containing protein [Brevundimonas vesicularis]